MTITAKFHSTCPTCSKTINPGERVNWQRGQRATHVVCPVARPVATPAQPQQAQHTATPAPAIERPIELDTSAVDVAILRRRTRDALATARAALDLGEIQHAELAIGRAVDACEAISPVDPLLGAEIGEVVDRFSARRNAIAGALLSMARGMRALVLQGMIARVEVRIREQAEQATARATAQGIGTEPRTELEIDPATFGAPSSAVVDSAPVGTVPGAGDLQAAVASASQATPDGLIMGYILPEDVNPVAGYYVPVIAAKGQPTRYADDRLHAAALSGGAAAVRALKAELGMAARAPQVTVRNAPLASSLPSALRDGIEAARARRAGVKVADGGDGMVTLRPGELIAGTMATDVATGVLISWSGYGQASQGQCASWVAAAGMSASYAPRSPSAHKHAGHAVEQLNCRGLVARADKRTGGNPLRRGYRARWIVGAVNHGSDTGENLGTIAITATLDLNDQLTVRYQGDDLSPEQIAQLDQRSRDNLGTRAMLAERVKATYQAARADERFEAGEVTDWLRGVLVSAFRAVRLGGSWYVPGEYAEQAEALCRAVASEWGRDWMLPALPITTSDKLREGLASSLIGDAEELLTEYRAARVEADKHGREIGEGKASGLMRRIKELTARAKSYGELLGDKYTAPIRAKLIEAANSLDGLVSDAATRGALIWDEIASEVK